MSAHQSQPDKYRIDAVVRVCKILETLRDAKRPLRLAEICRLTGLAKATAFRILRTLQNRRFVELVDDKCYRLAFEFFSGRRCRIGYGAESFEFSFVREVTDGLVWAARRAGVDIMTLDNRYSAKVAVRNAEIFIREGVDLVIMFQVEQEVAPVISSKLIAAGIPIIAVEIPHPGAVYYGADNYRAGLLGGGYLARWIKDHWEEQPEEILLLGLRRAGPIPNSRLAGFAAGLCKQLGIRKDSFIWLDTDGRFEGGWQAVRRRLKWTKAERFAVGAINDPTAVGAIRAFEEAGRPFCCAVVSFNAALEARVEMRQPDSPLVASVAYFPERYGEELITLSLDILNSKPTPPAVFVKHKVITPQNVDDYYPNDKLLTRDELEILLTTKSPVRYSSETWFHSVLED